MTFCVEFDEGIINDFPFEAEQVVQQVAEAVLTEEGCPYEACVNVLVTDNAGIREFNRQYREIDRETDVLSFPNLDFERPGEFAISQEREADYFDPDTGELVLGDIILSTDRIKEQAESYGHSLKREFAFLVAHSMLHLCGYDHMEEEEAAVMEHKQEQILSHLGITRDETAARMDK
jgi:probable rRNA maturation factor